MCSARLVSADSVFRSGFHRRSPGQCRATGTARDAGVKCFGFRASGLGARLSRLIADNVLGGKFIEGIRVRCLRARIIQQIKPNKAVTLSLQALQRCDEYFHGEIMWRYVRGGVEPVLWGRARNRDELIVDSVSALRFVLGLVVLVAKREVTSGTFHISHGVPSREGQNLRNLARHAYAAMYEHGWITADAYQTKLDELDENIRRAG